MAEPRLRFKYNNGDTYPAWKEYELDEILTERNEPHLITEDAPQMSFTIEQGVIYPEDKKTNKRDFLIKDKDNKKFLLTEYDDIIYNPANLKFGAIHRNTLGRGVVSPIYAIFYTNQNPAFIEGIVTSPKFIKRSLKYLEGTVIKLMTLKPRDFVKMKVWIPCLEEQKKIADFISFVDEVIAASEQEVANLETQKKAVMKKIFSQEVRFKKKDGTDFPEWEKTPVVPYCNVFCDGDWIESKDQSENGIRLVQTGNVGNGVFLAKESRKRFISNETFDRLHCSEVFPGDILISRLPDPAGRACIVPNSSERMITAVDCTIVRTDESKLIAGYLVQFYQSALHFKYVDSMLAGGTRQRVSRGNLEEEIIIIPCLEEQHLIADFLSDFDEAIAAAKKELQLWKELKKGLLQQMFV